MKTLKKDSEQHPISNILIVIMLTVGLVSLPTQWLSNLLGDTIKSDLIAKIIIRSIIVGVGVYTVFLYGNQNIFKSPFNLKGLLICIPALIVVLNNFPFVALMKGNAKISQDALTVFIFFIYTLLIGAFEEIMFRGIVFPICYYQLKDKKLGLFWSIALSSALFGVVHLVNLLAGANIGATFLQICYSFLIGAMCTIAMVKSGNIYLPIFLHGIFNFGGLIVENLGSGNIWITEEIILTAVIGVLVLIFYTYILLKTKNTNIDSIFN